MYLLVALTLVASTAIDAPQIVLYHSFDQGLQRVDSCPGLVKAAAGPGAALRPDGVFGKAAWFGAEATDCAVELQFDGSACAASGTLALWQILDAYEPLTVSGENLATLLDEHEKPILELTKSGHVYFHSGSRRFHLECFDALWWAKHTRNHLAVTWDTSGSGLGRPRGLLVAYWNARPYGALAVELGDRRPAKLVLGSTAAGLCIDELYLVDRALPQRVIWELMRQKPRDVGVLEKALAAASEKELARPAAVRDESWARAVAQGVLVEAEAATGLAKDAVRRLVDDASAETVPAGSDANVASGNGFVVAKEGGLSCLIGVPEQGEYALAIRYNLPRRMSAAWPQGSTAKTPWSDNFATVRVLLDGKPLAGDGAERLYPTGTYNGHAGDVLPWAWHAVAGGKKLFLAAGEHRLEIRFQQGLAQPQYDAVLLTPQPGLQPPLPRWIDSYRIPPAWWVAGHTTQTAGNVRRDVYTVSLRSRCDEPAAYEIVVGPDALQRQTARSDAQRIALGPHEEKIFRITFESSAGLKGSSEFANVYLWNEDVACQQMYRLWNNIPVADFAAQEHPVRYPKPDAQQQAALRAWLKRRDESALTAELKQWLSGPKVPRDLGLGAIAAFRRPLTAERLKALDAWMAMDEAALDQYLPDGPAENQGYGTGWERVGIELTGVWNGHVFDLAPAPAGDIDLVTELTAKGTDYRDKKTVRSKTWKLPADVDVIAALRDRRWQTYIGHEGSADGVPLLAEAYYLTGDPAYAKKAAQMLRIFARKYTGLTKHFWFELKREDRDQWGGRVDGRYQGKYGPRTVQAVGTYVLDLCWDALTPEERVLIEHNLIRWGMYEGMSGPLFDRPEHMAAVNREDAPYLAMGEVLGDPAPREGLQYFFDIYRDVVLADGLHICSIGSYGGVNAYAAFMQKLAELGVDVVSGNDALRNCFLAQPRMIFAGGGFPNIDDGGGASLQGLGAGFGCPSPEQYAWAEQVYRDPLLKQMPELLRAAKSAATAPPTKRAEALRNAYRSDKFNIEALWPNLYIAEVKGLAMLRNRLADEPVDWVEVIFDYGKYGGRSHGHPAKLATIPCLNGQIVSMDYGYGMHGTPASAGWHRRSYAHNVVVVDGRDQRAAAGPVQMGTLRGSFADKHVQWIDAESTRLYDGVAMRRVVFTTDAGIVDLHFCRAAEERTYDWMFHSFGKATVAAGAGNAPLPPVALAKEGPLSFAKHARGAATGERIEIVWENAPLASPPQKEATALLGEKTRVRLWALPERDTQVVLFAGPVNTSVVQEGEIDYAMLRRRAAATVFATVQEGWRESLGPRLRAVQPVAVAAAGKPVAAVDACALELQRTDGRRQVFFVNNSAGPKTVGRATVDADAAVWMLDAAGAPAEPRYSKGGQFRIAGN